MARLTPIIPITIDERNEIQLVAEAKQRVQTASNGLINELSAGSPISALIEGQAMAGAELLYAANKAPEAWTATFLSQVLGISLLDAKQAVVTLEFTRNQTNKFFAIPAGLSVSNTSGITFITTSPVVFLIGEQTKYVLAQCAVSGVIGNVEAGVINRPAQLLADISVNNPAPSMGGSNGETYESAKARAFAQLRRRNPVSADDWAQFIFDLLPDVDVKVYAATQPYIQIKENLFISPNNNAAELLEALSQYKIKTGLSSAITTQELEIISKQLELSRDQAGSIFIIIKANQSISEAILARVAEIANKYTQLGTKVFIQNALIHEVSVEVQGADNISEISDAVQAYFSSLGFGQAIDYSQLAAEVSKTSNFNDIKVLTGDIYENYGLSSEKVVGTRIYEMNKSGIVSFDTEIIFTDDKIPLFIESAQWKLINVTTSESNETVSRYGSLLKCTSTGSALRADGSGGTYVVQQDPACINNAPDI